MKNPTLLIRPVLPEHIPDLLQLIRGLAKYENAEGSVKITEEQLRRDGFAPNPSYRCLLATIDEKAIGFCLYWYRYSTWRGRLLYVEDLFVCEEYRRSGVGKALFNEVIKTAEKEGLAYISLQVLEWNEPAISFYRKHWKTAIDPEWLNVIISVK